MGSGTVHHRQTAPQIANHKNDLCSFLGVIVGACWTCGEPIVFRHVDGVLKPIHLNGGWYNAASSNNFSSMPFRTVESYVNPNAYCPVCGEKVYFYRSRYGGRVFFDDLGWPWPKHPCTDRTDKPLKTPPVVRGSIVIKDRHGKVLKIYDLNDLREDSERFTFTFLNRRTRARQDLAFSKKSMRKGGVTIDDFWDAPSFLIRKDEEKQGNYRVEFISCRLGKVLRFRIPRTG